MRMDRKQGGGRTFRGIRLVLSAALAGTLSVAAAVPALAGEPPIPLDNSAWSELEEKAERDGLVPVIVTLDVPGVPGDTLSPSKRAEISRAKGQLLNELGTEQPANLKAFDIVPIVAFQADGQDLETLKASNVVVSVVEDHEIALDVEVPAATDDGTTPEAPELAEGSSESTAGVSGTSSNGTANGQQLSQFWDWWRIGTDRARNAGYTGTGQTVVVIDTGVDRNNPYLTNRVVSEACFASAVANVRGAGACPNGSYYQYGTGAAAPCTFSAVCAHGTHVAHTAAGFYGTAQGANIIAIQVFHCCGTSQSPTYYESDLLYAMSYVDSLRATYRIAAINMSLGGGLFSGYCDNSTYDGTPTPASALTSWINYFRSKQIATVVSSGNNNSATSLGLPACISGAISVGNTTLDVSGYDAVFGYTPTGSNSNATLDLLAPGTDICSAVPTWLDGDGLVDGWQCGWIGTSMAAPHVAGAIAILKQKRPTATLQSIQNALTLSGYAVYDSRNGVSRTLINVGNALAYI